jgi:phytoene desaturase
MLMALLADGQMGVLAGGCRDFVGSLEARYRELGGEANYRSTVREIVVENDHATGVRLEDGTVHRADYVISATDGYSTIFAMLGGRYVNEKITRRYREWPLFQPVVMVSYGVAREFIGEPSASIIILEHPFSTASRPVDMLVTRILNYSDRFAPRGKTVVQVMFDSDWDYWYGLQSENKNAYKKEKSRVAAEVLERLQRHYPGIASQVEVTDVATPYTTWRYTLNHRGSYEGWLMQADNMMEQIERTLPGLSGFFMAGQWVVPGGGVAPSLYSGRHAVQLLCREDRKRFNV